MNMRRFQSGNKVIHKGKVWTVCKGGYPDKNKHFKYKVRRGAWEDHVRGDRLVTA
jgi:translation elongation factor P/translation initiation factor 5A